MAANFPASAPALETGYVDNVDDVLAENQNQPNLEINAIAAKVGTGASTPVAGTFLVGTGSGTSAWQSGALPVKCSGSEINTGTDDTKFATSKAIADSFLWTGWLPYSTVIPTRASADDPTYVLTFASVDLTSKMGVGMKVKFTQNSATVYGIITAIAFSTDTTVTLYCGTDYDVLDTASYVISAFYYSPHKAPLGFPMDPAKWTETVSSTTRLTQSSPDAATFYSDSTLQISIPIGCWEVEQRCYYGIRPDAAEGYISTLALSASTSSVSDNELKCFIKYVSAGSGSAYDFQLMLYNRKILSISSKTTYYTITSISVIPANVYILNDLTPGKVEAVCAYL